MRKWGIVISVFYAAIVIGLLIPAGIILTGTSASLSKVVSFDLVGALQQWLVWVPAIAVIAGQCLLLFLSVDTSQKRLKPRTHIGISIVVSSMLFGLLSFSAILGVDAAIRGEAFGHDYIDDLGGPLGFWGVLWIVWGIGFYLYFRNSTNFAARSISWLLEGSVLELLIAVPCHVIARRRNGCCAPMVTSFGIVSGIAVMLLCFGPSVLFLVKKRLDTYSVEKRV